MRGPKTSKRRGGRAHPASLADACAILMTCGLTSKQMTEAAFIAAIEAHERAPRLERARRDDAALTDACCQALRSTGRRLPHVPLRIIRSWSRNATPLPREWGGVPIVDGERPIVCAMLPQPFVGYVFVIARADDLRRPHLDAAAKDRIASALADALLALEGL